VLSFGSVFFAQAKKMNTQRPSKNKLNNLMTSCGTITDLLEFASNGHCHCKNQPGMKIYAQILSLAGTIISLFLSEGCELRSCDARLHRRDKKQNTS